MHKLGGTKGTLNSIFPKKGQGIFYLDEQYVYTHNMKTVRLIKIQT